MSNTLGRLLSERLNSRRVTAVLVAAGTLLAAGQVQADVSEVMREIERAGHARVLLRLKTGTGRDAWATAQSVAEQRSVVAAAAARAERSMSAARIPMRERFRTLPYAGARVDREQLLALAAMPEVAAVHLVLPERKQQLASGLAEVERPAVASSIPSIDVPAAWAKGYDGTGLTVAVIDGGFNASHPMLKGKTVGDACFADKFGTTLTPNCPSGATPEIAAGAASNCPAGSSRCDHGTHVASIAVGNDGTNFGVARGAKLMPIDVFSRDTDPADCSPDPTPCEVTNAIAVLDALDYINDNSAKYNIAAVNMSLGGIALAGHCDDDPRKPVIDMLRQKGIAVTVSAGNDGRTGVVQKPSCISSALAIGATDNGTTVASFSNFATTLDLVAPGTRIAAAAGTGSGLRTASGTSMAAPHVAGAWTLLRQAVPGGTADQFEEALEQTGVRVTRANAGFSVPRLQVMRAIDFLNGRDRKVFNHVISSPGALLGRSFLRVHNNSAAGGSVIATLRSVTSGVVLGTWRSPVIPAQASVQFSIQKIESEAQAAAGQAIAVDGRAAYNIELEATFPAYVQYLLWAQNPGVFANLTSCNAGAAADGGLAINVHASTIPQYVSRLRVTNTGPVAAPATLVFTDSATGYRVGSWTSQAIPSQASIEMTVGEIENAAEAIRTATAAGTSQYNVTLESLTGYLQHVIENQRIGALTDMSAKCAVPASPGLVLTQSAGK